jgi:hypothetical protein
MSALFTGALATLPYIRIEDEMNLEDIWSKMANQARLTPEELDFLKMQGRETQQRNAAVSGWIAGNGYPSWNLRPEDLGTISDHQAVKVYRNTNQSFANATDTNCKFTSSELPNGIDTTKMFDISVSDEKIKIKESALYLATAQIRYASNATGFRELALNDDSIASVVTRASTNAVSAGSTCLSVCSIFYWPKDTNVWMGGWQNSGGALNIDTAVLAIIRLRKKEGI